MTCKISLDVFFYINHGGKIFPGTKSKSKSNVLKFIKLIQFFSAEFCLPI